MRRAQVAARLLVAAFCGVTMLYGAVASSTFAYLQFLRPRVFPWTGTFADWHALVTWLWLAALALAVSDDVKRRWPGRSWAWGLLAACTAAAGWNALSPVLPSLSNDTRSLWVALAALIPLLWLFALDMCRAVLASPMLETRPPTERADDRFFLASTLAAFTVTAVFAFVAWLRVMTAFEPDLPLRAALSLGMRSATYHLVAFTSFFLVSALVVRMGPGGPIGRLAAWCATFTIGVAVVFDSTVGRALTLDGFFRPVLAVTAGMAVVGSWTGIRLVHRSVDRSCQLDPLALYFEGSSLFPTTTPLVGLSTIGVVAWAVPQLSALADWDDVVLRLGTAIVWTMTFGWAYRVVPPEWSVTNRSLALICATSLVGLVVLRPPAPEARPQSVQSASPLAAHAEAASARASARYVVYDPSFRFVRRVLASERAAQATFDRFLRANTGFTDVQLSPHPIDVVADLTPSRDRPPVFVFVIDSLRADYLSPYNSSVWFTPEIAAFAADSTVFTNAFTRYGGTGLSVPAIWAGSALPHKQYVQPFHPMNALEKLLDANAYRRFVSLDSIMVQLLQPSSSIEELDRGVTVMDYDLCRTLSELEGKLADTPTDVPVFAYSLPQNVHMANLSRWSKTNADFSGFFAPYAGRIQALDACFGRFVGALRRLHLYERSVVVLTSDHGDMLGEGGRFGHDYHMGPEVVRVPLIVHLPSPLPSPEAGAVRVNPNDLAFTTDIVPTIYAALGYHPAAVGRLMGRSLIHRTEEATDERRRDAHVLAASYGAVYAVVSRNGRRLYVADAVKGEDSVYERQAAAMTWSERPVSLDERAIEQYVIRRHVDETAAAFDVPRRDRP